jgi:MoaA/NifB/PqqE/SkfB family radical SAM enzyme
MREPLNKMREPEIYTNAACAGNKPGNPRHLKQSSRRALELASKNAEATLDQLGLNGIKADQCLKPDKAFSPRVTRSESVDNIKPNPHPIVYNQTMPSTFTVETILGCDLRCPECALGGSFIKRQKGWMNFDQFKIIADKIRPYCQYLYLHIWGEPLLNKDIFKIIEYSSRFTKTNISTNGHQITEKSAEALIKSGVTDIIVSIDGMSQDVYASYRVGGKVDRAIGALNRLQKVNLQLGAKVNIMPQFIVFRHNQHEMKYFADLCRSLHLRPTFKAPYLRNRNSSYSPSDYTQFIRPVYHDISALRSAMTECPNVKDVFTILLDGSAVICCHDYQKATCFGNIYQQSVEEIWNSAEFKKVRHCISSGNAPDFCVDECMTWFFEKSPEGNREEDKQ